MRLFCCRHGKLYTSVGVKIVVQIVSTYTVKNQVLNSRSALLSTRQDTQCGQQPTVSKSSLVHNGNGNNRTLFINTQLLETIFFSLDIAYLPNSLGFYHIVEKQLGRRSGFESDHLAHNDTIVSQSHCRVAYAVATKAQNTIHT